MNGLSGIPDYPLMRLVFSWLDGQPIISALLVLMVLDIVTGVIAAGIQRRLNSSISWQGMSKKAIMLIIIGVAAVLEEFSQGVPLAKIVATFYVLTESISVLENAGLAGVPLPQALTDMLVKLSQPTKPLPARRVEDPK